MARRINTILLTLMTCVAVSGPALAITRVNTPGMSCAKVQGIVNREGVAVLRYPSPRKPDLTLYDRYVRNVQYCDHDKVARWRSVPTADNPACPVLQCVQAEPVFDPFNLRLR